MKKLNRISRKNSRKNSTSQAKKPAVFVAGPEIPNDWEEVASIDFSGLLARDCEERIIYKTPEGNFKAARSPSDHGLEAIEDVQREQVARWIHECIIPEEFLADFSLQHESRRFSRDIMISRRRADVLSRLAEELKAKPQAIGENAIESYLAFIEEFPHLAEAQRRFVAGEALFAISPTGKLYDQLDRACDIYDLDRNSVVDSAVGAYIDMVLKHADHPALREHMLSCGGSSEPENIAVILSRPCDQARSMFNKLVDQISAQPFAQACNEFRALRELTMHNPALKNEREALEMIAEGADRLMINGLEKER